MNGPHLQFREFLDSHEEWIAVHRDGSIFALRSHEMEFEDSGHGALFGFLDRKGYVTWRLEAVEIEERRAVLDLSRRFGSVSETLELIPRAAAEELGADVREARLAAANEIGDAVKRAFGGMKLKRVVMNRPNARFARIILDGGGLGENGILADVSGTGTPERLITAAVLWKNRIDKSRSSTIPKIWILARRGKLAATKRLHACLFAPFRKSIGILATGSRDGNGSFEIKPAGGMRFEKLWNGPAPGLGESKRMDHTSDSRRIAELDPLSVDHLFAKNGITLRYKGLSFARFRELHGYDRCWFGVEKDRELLGEENLHELENLFGSLREYRRHDSPNKQHLYYQAAPEAWLESILRKDVKKLDRNLVLSPVYNQFRTSRDRIDLLALSETGRLVIIELKVSNDTSMVFQAVDYWRRIEHQRRNGVLSSAGLFGERKIEDVPAMIYLAAPALCFGSDVDSLVNAVRKDIRIVRFELNEDWRREVKVVKVSS
ncbi:MAG: hypothetical protein DWQ47_14000 [Acidobacteria bacterium]|nr:MAG: hypothetical protein DWQ32_01400 [Acidobacteriota bacterium]REK02817.1 MAG: hypothetical protein DWQ38_10735 [Acidobacteriota bacterium]REK13379.1 MAG: hypothetical protein DWQ43_07090 [Acidobacteriota bacterium]REK41373.1 MAG: hypothetical protein DWQ47_14000 [Acidobacteriota bacterium]